MEYRNTDYNTCTCMIRERMRREIDCVSERGREQVGGETERKGRTGIREREEREIE